MSGTAEGGVVLLIGEVFVFLKFIAETVSPGSSGKNAEKFAQFEAYEEQRQVDPALLLLPNGVLPDH